MSSLSVTRLQQVIDRFEEVEWKIYLVFDIILFVEH